MTDIKVQLLINSHKWIASQKIWSVEKLETLPAGTKPRTSHHQSPGGERGVKKGSARQSSFRGRERTIVNRMNIGTVSKATLGKLRYRVVCIYMGFSEHVDTISNWSEVNYWSTNSLPTCRWPGNGLGWAAWDGPASGSSGPASVSRSSRQEPGRSWRSRPADPWGTPGSAGDGGTCREVKDNSLLSAWQQQQQQQQIWKKNKQEDKLTAVWLHEIQYNFIVSV